jgi:hypothetical protein
LKARHLSFGRVQVDNEYEPIWKARLPFSRDKILVALFLRLNFEFSIATSAKANGNISAVDIAVK